MPDPNFVVLALVAAGQADATVNFDHLKEWDIAAGILLVEEAGGTIRDSKGKPLTFNQPTTKIMGVLAAKHGASSAVEHLLATVTKKFISFTR
jgi:myo-inositol-1(or 4)-monophosphatase